MRKIITVAAPMFFMLVQSANAQMMMAPPPPAYAVAPPPVVVAQPYCQPYSDVFKIGNEKRITRGTACLQPDGSWALHPEQAAVNYINRGGAMYIMPVQPFATVVIRDHHHHY